MKRVLFFLALVALMQSCVDRNGVVVEVYNPATKVRMNEMVELDYSDLLSRLQLVDTNTVVVLDHSGEQVPYQITHDNKLIFMPAPIEAGMVGQYRVVEGEPQAYDVRAVGAHYPQRVDDIAWENGCIAFRTYGPALQASGERAFGYDVWVKCVDYPVVADRYADELDPRVLAEIEEFRVTAPKVAASLYNTISYHVDHGNGLDYYKVGPTLGAGTAALLDNNGEIVYPYCYESYEILDNGPLRFTVSLRYVPFIYNNDTVTECRVITLDEGSQLNKISIKYCGLTAQAPVVSGIVLHDVDSVMDYSAEAHYAAYAERPDSINGQMFLGMASAQPVQSVSPCYFDDAERADRGAEGHLLMHYLYEPGEELTYYAGAGWSKWGFESAEDWFVYMRHYSEALATPLQVTLR